MLPLNNLNELKSNIKHSFKPGTLYNSSQLYNSDYLYTELGSNLLFIECVKTSNGLLFTVPSRV